VARRLGSLSPLTSALAVSPLCSSVSAVRILSFILFSGRYVGLISVSSRPLVCCWLVLRFRAGWPRTICSFWSRASARQFSLIAAVAGPRLVICGSLIVVLGIVVADSFLLAASVCASPSIAGLSSH
jgi:hypothetical protein